MGSTDPEVARSSAEELLGALSRSEQRLVAGYAGVEIPNLMERFREARERLEGMTGS